MKQVWKNLEVTGVFEEVSKVVPLWFSFKHVPHRKNTLENSTKIPGKMDSG
jgi:hypothetical protein